MKKNNKTKVLFFANIPVADEERSIGGATVLAKTILDFLQSDKRIEIKHQQIRRFWRNKLQLLDYFFGYLSFHLALKTLMLLVFMEQKIFILLLHHYYGFGLNYLEKRLSIIFLEEIFMSNIKNFHQYLNGL